MDGALLALFWVIITLIGSLGALAFLAGFGAKP